MTWPAVVLWVLIVLAAMSRGPSLLYLFVAIGVFGTLQMAPGELVGGANLLPQSVCAIFLVAKVLMQRGNLARAIAAACDVRAVGLFTLFLVFALVSAIAAPRLFIGQIDVIPVTAAISGVATLAPSSANVTQSGYMVLSYATALCFCILGARPEFQRHYLGAILFGGATLVATGVLDMMMFYSGLGALLDPFRNASYGLLIDVEAAGTKRVTGLLSEASVFGSYCVNAAALLTFLRPCFEPYLRRWIVPIVIASLLFMAAMSTSSSAYIGLAVFAMVYAVNWLIRLHSVRALSRETLIAECVVICLGVFCLAALIILKPGLLTPAYDMIDVMVFKKTTSASFIERSLWTRVGWNAFLESGGVGAGLGSLRTSNWFVSIVGSTGLLGGGLLFGFLIRLLIKPLASPSDAVREMTRGLRCALVPNLVIAWISGTIPDMGVATAAIFGLLAALLSTRSATWPVYPLQRPGRDTSRRAIPLASAPRGAAAE